ncbi:MAG: hypothetical protein KKG14_06320 [Alphaproteobacteria bacterium]|nr:hypothetical protein [Alphaproteobacteria bacterium]MBU2272152.1 hypothetical protein [Alphaproteobacteria bacterium]MBU2418296.1 hypothetical protein [Alphaproteobacteria bacterium]
MMMAMMMAAALSGGDAQAARPDLPLLAGAAAAPDCGNQAVLAGAWCVSAPLSAMEGVAQAYVAELTGKGWLVADGGANRAVLLRRKDGGGCETVQMLIVRDTSEPTTADSVAWLGVATVPGDVCAPEAGQ